MDIFHQNIFLILIDKNHCFFNVSDLEIKERYLSLNIYYDTIEYSNIESTPQTVILDLISNIGGIFGLFIGISLLSFIEIFELIFNLIAESIQKKRYANAVQFLK